MDFDKIIDRRGTQSAKWDEMEALYGVSPDDGLAMWVADTDFAVPDCVSAKLREMADHGIWGETLYIGVADAEWAAGALYGELTPETLDKVTRGNGLIIDWPMRAQNVQRRQAGQESPYRRENETPGKTAASIEHDETV